MKYVITNEDAGVRLDVFLSKIADITRSRAGTLIKEGMAFLNGKILYEDGKFTTVDADEIYERANMLANEICGK